MSWKAKTREVSPVFLTFAFWCVRGMRSEPAKFLQRTHKLSPGLLGMLCWVLTASLLTAYMLLGFAVLHATTRTLGGRVFILAGSYLTVMLLGWPALAVAILGLLDSALDIRGRIARKRANSTRSG